MVLPSFLLKKTFPRLELSKIIVEGSQEDFAISIEVEVLQRIRKNQVEIGSGIAVYSLDEDVTSLNNLQDIFEQEVIAGRILSFSNYPNINEKIVEEGANKFSSKTYKVNLPKDYFSKKNVIAVYGSWLLDPTTRRLAFSRTSAEKIIGDGNILSESYIYFLQGTQDIWDGEIQLSQDGLTFVTVEQIPRQLERYKTKNYKLQDFRTNKQLQKSIADYQEINNKILNARSRQLFKSEKSKKKYFTDSYIAQKDNVLLMFGINFRDIVLDNSFLGKDPTLPLSIRQELFYKSQIIDLKIVKRRVLEVGNNDNPLSDIRKTVKPFPGSQEEVICSGKDIDSVFFGDENIKEINNVMRDMQGKMRFFSCIDQDINKKKDSLYQYGIKLEIMDGSNRIISSDISELQNSRNQLKEMYNNLEIFLVSELNSELHNEEKSSELVSLYLSKLSRYYEISDLDNIRYKLEAFVSPVSLDLDYLNNFISLHDSLISNLQNMIGEKNVNLGDPHIVEELNIQKNTKNIFSINHYFKDNIYDFSLENVKRVTYLPINMRANFNEFSFSQIDFSGRQQITTNSGGKPVQTLLSPEAIYNKKAKKVIGRTEIKEYLQVEREQYDRIIRKNLLSHINIEITKTFLKETNLKQENQEQTDRGITYQEDLAEMYKYFSATNVSDKQIDEVFDLYDDYEDDFLARVHFLQDYSSFTGEESWLDLSNLLSHPLLDEEGYVICRLKPVRKDYRSSKWNISSNLRALDMFFLLKVENLQDINTSYSSLYGTNFVASTNKTTKIKTKEEEQQKQVTLQDAETTPTQRSSISKTDKKNIKEKIKSKAEQVKKSTRNWVL
jgi:hypothetical protein